MNKTYKFIGLDVHKKSISIAVADDGRDGKVRYYGKISNDMDQLDKVIRKFISQGFTVNCVYESGPCGFNIYRHLTGNGIKCSVIAPSKTPRKSGDRIKNDRRDAITLAKQHRTGDLTAIYVPEPEDEALRDLTRAREDNVQALRRAKQQLKAFLLRHSITYSGNSLWTNGYFAWLAEITMEHPAQQLALQEYIDTVHTCKERIDRLTKQMRQLADQSRLKPLIKALQALRGISSTTAIILAAELGTFHRFNHPDQLMAYLGLIPSEYSSGDTVKRGPITKTGNRHIRKALIESAQAYRLPARKSKTILKRQKDIPEAILNISWKAQCRLCGRYRQLVARGKKVNVAKTAIARELAAFAWAIAQEVEMPEAA